jgi:biopolymer transport protein ExbD
MPSAKPQFKLSALRRRNELLCRIDMWGFVSVMLVLLFLLMPWTVVDRRGPAADLVGARHSTRMPGALKEDVLKLVITRDGSIYLREHYVTLEDLPNEIREGLRSGAERKVYIAVDARAKYGDVPAVLNKIRLAGVEGRIPHRVRRAQD